MAKLAIIEQTVQFCCVFIYENDCGNVPNIRKRLQYVLCGGGCPKTYQDSEQLIMVTIHYACYICLTLYILENQLFCLYL